MKSAVKIVLALSAAYLYAAWHGFMWRNPTANPASFYRNFSSVVKWEKLPEFQLTKQ